MKNPKYFQILSVTIFITILTTQCSFIEPKEEAGLPLETLAIASVSTATGISPDDNDDDDADDTTGYTGSCVARTGSNNSALCTLTEGSIGMGTTTDATTLQKQGSVSLTNSNSNFTLGTLSVTRLSPLSEGAFWILPITNVSSQDYCSVTIQGIVLKSADGSTLASSSATDYGYVIGSNSINALFPTLSISACLKAGETGYLLGIELTMYSDLAEIMLDRIEMTAATTLEDLESSVMPQSIVFEPTTFELAMTVQNNSSTAKSVSIFSRYVLLDANDLPLLWGFFIGSATDADDPIAAGATKDLEDITAGFYAGSAVKIIGTLSFGEGVTADVSRGSAGSSARGEYERDLLRRYRSFYR